VARDVADQGTRLMIVDGDRAELIHGHVAGHMQAVGLSIVQSLSCRVEKGDELRLTAAKRLGRTEEAEERDVY
jgi:hypothetical protein